MFLAESELQYKLSEMSGSHGGKYEDESSGILHCVVLPKLTYVSGVHNFSIALMTVAVHNSETLVNLYETKNPWHYRL
jgi:hypothetical protein